MEHLISEGDYGRWLGKGEGNAVARVHEECIVIAIEKLHRGSSKAAFAFS
jgi:hypothetical protein